MLKAHTDKEIIVAAVKKFTKDPIANSREFIDFLRNGSDLVIYGKPNQNECTILMKFLQGRQNCNITKIDDKFSFPVVKINNSNPYQVFFLNESRIERSKKVEEHPQFLFGFIDDYDETYKKLSNESYHRVGDVESNYEFSTWSEVFPDLPVKDIIITDPYLFYNNKGRNPLEENYFELLKEIKRKYKAENIIVFAPTIDHSSRKKLISESINILGQMVNFQLLPFKRIKEHDRYIFFSYAYVNAGSSLNYRNDTGEIDIKSTSKITVHPLCHEKHFVIARDVLRTLKEELEKLKEKGLVKNSINSDLFYFLNENKLP